MPLVILTGYPCSGKTRRADELVQHWRCSFPDKRVAVVSDNQFTGFDFNSTYESSANEKSLRAFLKSEVQRQLSKDVVIILDSLNYIKGYRYELYCIVKSVQTPHCTIWCDVSIEQARVFNKAPGHNSCCEKLLVELAARYEEPNPGNRWDSPLFVIHPDDSLPIDSIDTALFKNKPPPPNMSTVAQPLQPTDFLYELDKVTNNIIKEIFSAQKTAMPGETIIVSNAKEFHLTRHFSLADLNKNRRQFITYMKLKPVAEHEKLPHMFIQYLQTALQ